jgi:CNT family concentrative nucleoside transporter
VKANPNTLDPRSITLASYALCGFANFSSIAIQIGGIGALAPSRRADLAKLGLKSMIAGLLACYLFAAVVGVLI